MPPTILRALRHAKRIAGAAFAQAVDFGRGKKVLAALVCVRVAVPLLVLAYGIGNVTKVSVVCIMAMRVIVLNSFTAVRHTPRSLIEIPSRSISRRAS
jgi:hypothetical protein